MAVVPQQRWLTVEQVGDVGVARFTRRRLLDEGPIQATGEQLYELVEDPGLHKFILDFGRVEALSSALVGKLFALHRRLRETGGRLVLCGVRPHLFEVFEVLKIPQLFRVYRTEQEALQAL